MGSKNVRLDVDVYERIKSEKRPDETFSETIERLIGDYGLIDFADDVREAEDVWDTAEMERAFEESDRRNREELDEQLP